jgi:hypothetical protein
MFNTKQVVFGGFVVPFPRGPALNGLRLAAVFLLALLAAPGAGSPIVATADEEIRAELERYYTDFSARDWEKFADHFWSGATITTVWTPPGETAPRVVVTSIPDFVAKAPEGPGSKPIFEEKMTGAEMRVHGNWPRCGRYERASAKPAGYGGQAPTPSLMKHGGRWRSFRSPMPASSY